MGQVNSDLSQLKSSVCRGHSPNPVLMLGFRTNYNTFYPENQKQGSPGCRSRWCVQHSVLRLRRCTYSPAHYPVSLNKKKVFVLMHEHQVVVRSCTHVLLRGTLFRFRYKQELKSVGGYNSTASQLACSLHWNAGYLAMCLTCGPDHGNLELREELKFAQIVFIWCLNLRNKATQSYSTPREHLSQPIRS